MSSKVVHRNCLAVDLINEERNISDDRKREGREICTNGRKRRITMTIMIIKEKKDTRSAK